MCVAIIMADPVLSKLGDENDDSAQLNDMCGGDGSELSSACLPACRVLGNVI